MDRRLGAHARRRRLRRARRRILLRVSRGARRSRPAGRRRAASSAKRIISTPPCEKFGAWKHGNARLARRRVDRVLVEPGRPDDDRDALFEAALDVAHDRLGPGEVDRRVAACGTGHERVDDLMARPPGAPARAPIRPSRRHRRARSARAALRGLQEPGIHLRDRLAEAGLVRADSRCRELPGREELPGERRDVLGRTRRRAGAGSR